MYNLIYVEKIVCLRYAFYVRPVFLFKEWNYQKLQTFGLKFELQFGLGLELELGLGLEKELVSA